MVEDTMSGEYRERGGEMCVNLSEIFISDDVYGAFHLKGKCENWDFLCKKQFFQNCQFFQWYWKFLKFFWSFQIWNLKIKIHKISIIRLKQLLFFSEGHLFEKIADNN